MPANFDPTNPKLTAKIGTEKKIWIHERALLENLSDTQYVIKMIDAYKTVIEQLEEQ